MPNYLTDRTFIDSMFGPSNVSRHSDPDNTGDANVQLVNILSAIAGAEELIDDLFRDSIYAVPLSPVNETVKRWTARIAYADLYLNRGQREGEDESDQAGKFNRVRDKALKEINGYLAGTRRGPWNKATSYGRSPAAVVGTTNVSTNQAIGTGVFAQRKSDSWPQLNPPQG